MEAGVAMHAEIVLGVAGADHDVAHAQRRIEAARHAAHQERAATEAVEQQRGRHAGIDLAGAQFDEYRLAAGDLAAPEREPADFLGLARAIAEMGELLGQGRYDAQKPVCHGRMGYKVAAAEATDRMPPALPSHHALRDACSDFARAAAREIMRIYAGDLGERTKADKSPVTDADHAAEEIIVAGLRGADARHAGRRRGGDGGGPRARAGRRAVLAGRSARRHQGIHQEERRVHRQHRADRGRQADARHRAGAGAPTRCGAARRDLAPTRARSGGAFTAITTRTPPADGLTACASRSHAIYSDLDIWFRSNGLTVAERMQAGSSLKFCLIAEGKADIYPRFGPTNEWDTAAGQGVLEAAGGEVVTTDGRPLAYGKPGFGNPHFIARSKAAR